MAKTKDVYTHRFHARAMRERERGEKFCAVNLQCQRLWYTRGVREWLVVIATIVLAMTDER